MSVSVHEAFAFDSAQDRFFWIDHFLGDQLQDEWRAAGTGSAVVVDQQTGGIVRITTGAVTNNEYWIDWQNIRSLHVDQKVSMETRVKLTQTGNTRSILVLHFDWTNFIEFRYDSGTSANWRIRCQDGGVGASFDSGIAADTSYHIFRFECHTHGSNHVHFYIGGTETGNSPITANIPDDATDYLQPLLIIRTLENVAKTMDIDYVAIRQDR